MSSKDTYLNIHPSGDTKALARYVTLCRRQRVTYNAPGLSCQRYTYYAPGLSCHLGADILVFLEAM